jgi:DNA-binding CsgD family transcriptional regulator
MEAQNRNDLTGRRFGRLVVIGHIRRPVEKRLFCLCRCDCGRESTPTRSNLLRGITKSCGTCCRSLSIEARLWSQVIKTETCWVWTGHSHHGYGTISWNNRAFQTHRVSYELFVGPIPDGLQVLHRCDNPPCLRPDHLFLGTQAENIADMIAKGRGIIGKQNGHAKLTESSVRSIRELYAGGGNTQKELAREFGVHPRTISQILQRKKWRHI